MDFVGSTTGRWAGGGAIDSGNVSGRPDSFRSHHAIWLRCFCRAGLRPEWITSDRSDVGDLDRLQKGFECTQLCVDRRRIALLGGHLDRTGNVA